MSIMQTDALTNSLPPEFQQQARLLASAGIEATTIIDGGAYVGELTAQYLEAFPEAHIWAMEPALENFARLASRFEDEARVTPVLAALAEHSGNGPLHLNDTDMTHSMLPLHGAWSYADYPKHRQANLSFAPLTLTAIARLAGFKSECPEARYPGI
jgi:FkbM family methyltransferase